MTWIDTCSIPLKERSSYIFLEYGRLDVEEGAFVLRDSKGSRVQIPVGAVTCIMLGPGTDITHEAVKLAAAVKCLLVWVGEYGVRLYSAGMPGGHRCDRLLEQARCALDPDLRKSVVYRMYQYRFDEPFSPGLSLEQMRGKEAYRVKSIYRSLSEEYGVTWTGRRYDANNWSSADVVNRLLSTANSCLYGICEAAILIAGYSPSIGFIHSGRPRSFVYDVADLMKYETVVPLAFRYASDHRDHSESDVRQECREMFRKERILERIVPLINSLFEDRITDPGGVVEPPAFSESDGGFYSGADS
ncbi:MAG: type I-E CRISPR-associated endonuclease Cas1 [Thermoplasmata archaeon]|nr:type I-E CRISPR-associated endonuclease Cas1 [Thermoplasmata archaeon]